MRFRKLGKTIAVMTCVPLISIFGATYYYFPELRSNKKQLFFAFSRMLRVIKGGVNMLGIYFISGDTWENKHERAAKILKTSFLANAGLYIKFGQLIASLDVLVPDQYRKIMEDLCEYAPQSDYLDVKNTIEVEFNKPIDEIFSEFNKIPLKSASIAQVHEAKLKENGKKVAVKIQHKWLKEQCSGDISLVELFIYIGENLFPGFRYKWLGEEMRANIPQELDFINEGKNSDRCKKIFEKDEQIKVPEVYWKYTTERVLTMEFIEGYSIGDLEQIQKYKIDLKEVAKLLNIAFSRLIFKEGFVHSDPHQGNLYVNQIKNSKGKIVPQLILLDHGIYKILDEKTRINYTKLWKGILMQDESLIETASENLGAGKDYKLFAAMIVSRTFEDIMKNEKDVKQRLRRFNSEEEKEKLIVLAKEFHRDITIILQKINRDLLLLFKTHNFLSSINHKIGSPINNFEIMIDICHDVLYENSWKDLPFYKKFIILYKRIIMKIKFMILKIMI